MKHSNARKSKLIIWLGLVLVSVLVFVLALKLYLPINCLRHGVRNENQGKTVQLTSKQQRQLRDFISEEIHSKHPNHSYGFSYHATKRNFACVEVHIGRDLRLNRTPSTDQGPSDYNESWAMLYLFGQWRKLSASRLED
jgi:hypothetical protein